MNRIFKTVSWVLLFTFSSSQIVCADDLGYTNIGKALDRLNSEESATFAPAYIQYQEISHQELVQLKQEIENLSNSNIPLSETSAAEDGFAARSEETVDLKGPQGGSGQPSVSSESLSLTSQEAADAIEETGELIEDGTLMEYLAESALYKERVDMLARTIAIAREGSSAADVDLLDAAGKVSLKEGEIASILEAISSAQETSEEIRNAIQRFSDESVAALNELSRAQDFLSDTSGQEAAFKNALSELKTVVVLKKAELNSATLELEFARIDLENSISLIQQNLGADFDIYSLFYETALGPDGRITSVTLQDRRDALELLVADAIKQVGQSEQTSLDGLDVAVREAKDKVYEDEAVSLGQLDGLCEQRIDEIIAARDVGFADIEQQRIDVTAEANSQFGSLYASVSAQASYWGSRKAALYQSGQIEAYIYAATMATVYSNQAQSVWSQWQSQIAGINQQCDDALIQLASDAEAAVNNVPAEKEAAIADIAEQRDSLLAQIDSAALEQEAGIHAERDNALAAISEQASEALSVIAAEESLILAAWREHYIADDLEAIIIGKGAEVAIAEDAYAESEASYGVFLENVSVPAQAAYGAALNAYNTTLENIASNESALTSNEANIASLNGTFSLLTLELSALEDSLAGKIVYRDGIAGLLADMLDAEKLLMIRAAEMTDYYALLLSQKEDLGSVSEKEATYTEAPLSVSENVLSAPATVIDHSPEPSASSTSNFADAVEASPLLDTPSELAPPDTVPTTGSNDVSQDAEADRTGEELLIRDREMSGVNIEAGFLDSTLLDIFRNLFDRDATEGGIDIFNQIMLAPRLPAIKLIDASEDTKDILSDELTAIDDYYLTEDGTLYHIVDSRVVSATIEDRAYMFDASGNIDRVLSRSGNEILDYLYNDAGELISVNFSNARVSLESARDSASNALAEKFDSHTSALDEQKKILADEINLKHSACLASIEERAESLKGGALKEYSERVAVLENEKAKLGALQDYLEKKTESFEGLSIDSRVYTSDATAGDIEAIRGQIHSIDEAIQGLGLDKDDALQTVDDERAKAISVLDGERDGVIADISAKIEGIANSIMISEETAKANLGGGVDIAFSAIKTQEDFSLIRHYFKESLGREPTYDEMAFCVENGYTTKESLSGSVFREEMAARQAFKENVIERVRTALESDGFSSLGEDETAAILDYLDGQSLHFGTSALAPLSDVLRTQDIEASEEELLTELILSEIAAGNLGQNSNAPLKISMDAMIGVAQAHGVGLAGFDATMDELEAALNETGESAIALINKDHYVAVVSIDGGTVTYIDPSMGKDGANVTMSKDEFKEKFSGNVIASAVTIDSSKLLSKDKLIAAKGAGFFDWLGKVFGWIGDFFGDIFEAIGRFVSNVVNSIVNGIKKAVDVIVDVARNIAMIPVNFVKDIAAGNWANALWTVGSLIPGVGAIKSAIEGDWVSAGIQAGALLLSAAMPGAGAGAAASGVGKVITDFASSIIAPIADTIAPLVSGIRSVVGGISNVVGAFGNAIGNIAISVGQVFKPITDLTSSIISSISASPIGQVVATIKDGIVGTTDGIGNIFGISNTAGIINDLIVTPTISTGILEGAKVTLTDLGLSGTIADLGGAAISGYAGAYMSGNGAIAIPITLGSIASQSFKELGATFDFDETVTSAISLISGVFVMDSAINYDQNNITIPPEDALGSEGDDQPYLGRIDVVSAGEMSSYSLSGISEDSPTYILYDSIDTVITGSELLDRMAALSLLNVVSNSYSNSTDSSAGTGSSGTANNAQDEQDENHYLLMNGINNKELFTAPLYMKNFAAKLDNVSPGTDDISLISLYNDNVTINDDTLADLAGSHSLELFESLQVSGYVDSRGLLTKAFCDLGKASDMILYDEFMPKQEAIFTTLKNMNKGTFDDLGDLSRDVLKWLANTGTVAAQIDNEIALKYGSNWPEDATAMCYSGSGDPFIYLLNNKPQYDVNSIVLVGTPIKGERTVENPNIKTIITIYGENDPVFFLNEGLRKDFYAVTGKLFANNPNPINEVVIKLKDADHFDYFYDSTDSGSKADLQKKAAEFIARVTALTKDGHALEKFLMSTDGISKDIVTGKYTVDLKKVVYDE